MLKKVFKSIVVFSFACLCACTLAGCSDSDNNGDGDGNVSGKEYKMSDLVGTWEIVKSEYTRKENGKVVETRSETNGHNRIVFYPSGYYEYLEYDGNSSWHEDGKGTFYLRNGKFVFEGDFENVVILSLSETKAIVRYSFIEDKSTHTIEKEYIDTLERIE